MLKKEKFKIVDNVLVKYFGESKKVVLPNTIKSIGKEAFKNCYSLKRITLPNGLKSIEDNAFYGCSALQSIYIPSSVERISKTAFYYCNVLIIYVNSRSEPKTWNSSWNFNRIVYWNINEDNFIEKDGIQYVIENGKAIVTRYVGEETTIELPLIVEINEHKYEVESIGDYAFSFCSSVQKVVCSLLIKSIGKYAFKYCESLQEIELFDRLVSIKKGAFSYCDSLMHLPIPISVSDIEKNAFENCLALKSIELPNQLQNINKEMFKGCISLKRILIPNSVSTIEEGAFKNCNQLEEIQFDLSSELKEIKDFSFENCLNLENITIPYQVENIGEFAFQNTTLKTAVVLGNLELIYKLVTQSENDISFFIKDTKERLPKDVMDSQITIYFENEWAYLDGKPVVLKQKQETKVQPKI